MKTGHFYFGKNRTFLNWLDKGKVRKAIDRGRKISGIMLLKKSGGKVILIFYRPSDPRGK